jgi:chromosome segregation protein
MRVEELSLERYGAFADRRLVFRPEARLHVVLGRNEAGKTTALSAISDLLFGFPNQSAFDFRHEAKSLRIGARLRLKDGRALAFRRRKGRERTLIDEADAPLADDLLAPVLGGVTREIFLGEFGLTAERLREGGRELARAGGRLSEALAASSAGLSALSHLRARFEEEAESLFTARRVASKPFYAALDAHHKAERDLRDALVTREHWSAARAAVTEAETHAQAQRAAHEDLGRDIARLQRARRVKPKLRRLDLLREELAALGGAPLDSAAALAAWRAALTRQTDLSSRLADLDADEARAAARRDALRLDAGLLADGAAIDALRERIGAIKASSGDLPKREEAQRAAADLLSDAARRLGFADQRELLAQQPTDAAIARAEALIGRGRMLAERVEDMRGRLERAEAELARHAQADGAQAHSVDPAPLALRLEIFDDAPALCEQARRETQALAADRTALAEAFARLSPRPASLDALSRAPLPLAAQAGAAQAAEAALAEARRDLATQQNAATQALHKAERAIAGLAAHGVRATRGQLLTLRAARDAAFARLRDGDGSTFDALAAATRDVDQVTDLLLSEGEQAARLQAAETLRDDARAHLAELAARKDALATQDAERLAAWRLLWRDCGVEPAEPSRMAAWLDAAARLLTQRADLLRREAALAALTQKLSGMRAPLAALRRDLRMPADDAEALDTLWRGARAALDAAQKIWSDARARQATQAQAEAARIEAEAELRRAEAARDLWRGEWPEAVAALGLAASAQIEEAQAALAVWRHTPQHFGAFARESRSVDGIRRDLDAFARDVAALCVGAQADLAALAPRDALDALSARLTQARQAAEEARHLDKAAADRAEVRATLRAKGAAAVATLAQACAALSLPDAAALEPALTRLEQANARAADATAAEADLAGETLDEPALRAEARDLDADALDAMIAEREAEQRRLVQEIEIAGARLSDAHAALADLEKGHDAASALTRSTEAAGDMADIARRYLVRVASARLAARAIERRRAAVQDPVVARAGEMFARITGGSFAGLKIDYDDKDRAVLVGRRADGGGVPIDGMSEGARDQLFLTLRLALLATRAAEPLPFIGDDLLASFDEARVTQAVALLISTPPAQQIILFTHHAHVAEIARARGGDAADVIEL